MGRNLNCFKIKTRWGFFDIAFEKSKIVSVKFPSSERPKAPRFQRWSGTEKLLVNRCEEWFCSYFEKAENTPIKMPISFELLTTFQKKVLRALSSVPRGEVRSYQWLARKCKMGRGYRAAGQVLGSNPYPVLFPCHRIVRKDGSLSGFSGGVAWKKKLLQFEGVRLTKDGKVASKIIG